MGKYLLLILSLTAGMAYYINAKKVELKKEDWFVVKGKVIQSSYKTHLGGTTHGVEPVIHDCVFKIKYELNSEIIKTEYVISGKEWYVDEQLEGQEWKIGSAIDVYVKYSDNTKILLNPKFGRKSITNYIVYVLCGVFALLGLAQIFGTDFTPEKKVKKQKKKKQKKKKQKHSVN